MQRVNRPAADPGALGALLLASGVSVLIWVVLALWFE